MQGCKKTLLSISVALLSSSAVAQEIIPVNDSEMDARQARMAQMQAEQGDSYTPPEETPTQPPEGATQAPPVNPAYQNTYDSNSTEGSGSYSGGMTGDATSLSGSSASGSNTLNDYLLTSGAKISEKGIKEISTQQEQRAVLDSKIRTQEAEKRYLQLQREIAELSGAESGDVANVEMIGVNGTHGELDAVISYGETQFNIEKGDILNGSWVVTDVSFEQVNMFNIETKDEKILQFNGPTILKKYEASKGKE